jgi:hypothetical protein
MTFLQTVGQKRVSGDGAATPVKTLFSYVHDGALSIARFPEPIAVTGKGLVHRLFQYPNIPGQAFEESCVARADRFMHAAISCLQENSHRSWVRRRNFDLHQLPGGLKCWERLEALPNL